MIDHPLLTFANLTASICSSNTKDLPSLKPTKLLILHILSNPHLLKFRHQGGMGICSCLVALITESPITDFIGYFFSVTSVCHTLSEPSHYFERFLRSHNWTASESLSNDRPLASPPATHCHALTIPQIRPVTNAPTPAL